MTNNQEIKSNFKECSTQYLLNLFTIIYFRLKIINVFMLYFYQDKISRNNFS